MDTSAGTLATSISNVALTHFAVLRSSFQVLLLSSVFCPTLPSAAGIALIFALLLVSALILCTFCGRYFYKFPQERQI